MSNKERRTILDNYPPPVNFPGQAPESEPNWQQIMNSGAKAREKELFHIAQQLLELAFPITHLVDYLQECFPDASMDWGIVLKDFFSLFGSLQAYIHTLRRENVVRATAGSSALAIMRKRKEVEPLMGEGTESALKSWAKTQEAVKRFKGQQQLRPFQRRGNFQGRGKFPQTTRGRSSKSFIKFNTRQGKFPTRQEQEK